MNQIRKEEVIQKIRKCSLGIGIICVLSTLINATAAVMNVIRADTVLDQTAKQFMLSGEISYIINTVIMLLASLIFFSMQRSGRPFTPKKTRVVIMIALLLLAETVATVLVQAHAAALPIELTLFRLFMSSGFVGSILFLFAGLIMYYASLLQQESDETL